MATASPLARARRSTELSLVVMAGMITAIAYTFASLGQYTQIPARIIPFLLTLLGLLLLAHLAVRWFARGAEPTLLPLVALLHGIGYVMITRLEPERLAGLQTTWSIIAIVAFVADAGRRAAGRRPRPLPLDVPRSSASPCSCCRSCPASAARSAGARIWVSLGPVNFQPGEFAKIAFAIFFAGYLADNRQLIAGGTWKVGPLHLPEPRAFLLPCSPRRGRSPCW